MKRRGILFLIILIPIGLFSQSQTVRLTEQLIQAIAQNKTETVDALLKVGVDVDGVNSVGMTPLVMAIIRNQPQTVEKLLKQGANPVLRTVSGIDPILIARENKQIAIEQLLINQIIQNGEKHHSYLTLLVLKKDVEAIQKYIQQGFPLNKRDTEGATALMYAVYHQSVDIVQMLIKGGASVHIADNDGMTPLHIAAAVGSIPIINLLLTQKQAINNQNLKGDTPLLLAVKNKKYKVANELIQKGANPAISNYSGKNYFDFIPSNIIEEES